MSSSPASAAAEAGAAFHRTRCHCCDCGAVHDAVLREENGGVVLEVDCPRGTGTAHVSSDAAIFRGIRARSALGWPPLAAEEAGSARRRAEAKPEHPTPGFTWVNILEVTRDCNCACPVCFAGSRPGAGGYLSVEEFADTCRALRAQGLASVSISGGEPTLHPRLEELVRAARREKLDVTVISNGLLLGEDPALARRLARSGARYVYLQLDTLHGDVCAKIRGDRRVDARLRALGNAAAGGLRLGVNATVVRENLPEVGALLRRAAEHAPALGIVTFLAAGRTGRFLLPESSGVTREDVVRSLVASGAVEGLSADHFWPLPRFAPLGLDVHPDCAALLLVAVDRGVLRPLDGYLDVAALWQRMRAARGGFGRIRAALLFNLYLWRSVRLRKVVPFARMIVGLLSGRGRSSILAVMVEQFLDGRHQDEERLERCTTCSVRAGGARVPMCLFQHPDPRRSPATRVNGG